MQTPPGARMETEILEGSPGARPALKDRPYIRVLLLGSTHNNSPPEHMGMTRDEKRYLKIRKYLYIQFQSRMGKEVTVSLSLEFLENKECCCFFESVKAFEFTLQDGESRAIKISPKLSSRASPSASPMVERREKPKKRGKPHTRNRAHVPVIVDGVRMTTVPLRFYNKSSSLGTGTHEVFYFYPEDLPEPRSFTKDTFQCHINGLTTPVVLLDQAGAIINEYSIVHTPSPESLVASSSALPVPIFNLQDQNANPYSSSSSMVPSSSSLMVPSSSSLMVPSSSSLMVSPSSPLMISSSSSASSSDPVYRVPLSPSGILTPGPPHPMGDDESAWPLSDSSEENPFALQDNISNYGDSNDRFL